MARHESDREDLLREATALVERVELSALVYPEPIVVGFRRDGSASLYFGADPVYQFNSAGELRRAYIDGLIYKAERGRLVILRRQRLPDAVALQRTDLSQEQSAVVLQSIQDRLVELREAILSGSYTVLGQIPPHVDIAGRIRGWLTARSPMIKVANIPNVR